MRLLILFTFCLLSRADTNLEIDRYFLGFQGEVPGAAVAVFQNGQSVYEKGYGLAELDSNIPVHLSTNFRIASLSKQFTAVAILQLVAAKELHLDAKLETIFSDLPGYARAITIRQLLNHTGGFRDYEDLIPAGQIEQLSDYDVFRILKRQSSGLFSPGSQYRYSNSGYVILGLVVETVSGMLFSDFLRSRIFHPLGMENSLMYERFSQQPINHRAYGHSRFGNEFRQTDQSLTSATRGDGGVYTSVHEWYLWENALNGSELIPEDLKRQMFTPGKLNNGTLTKYGFGWMLGTENGNPLQSHTGSSIGFRTAVRRIPHKNLAIVVFINRSESSPWEIARSITRLF